MAVKASVTKQFSIGEVLSFEFQGTSQQVNQALDAAYEALDGRLLELNKRIVFANDQYQKIVKESPVVAVLVNDLIYQLAGQTPFKGELVDEARGLVAKQMAEASAEPETEGGAA